MGIDKQSKSFNSFQTVFQKKPHANFHTNKKGLPHKAVNPWKILVRPARFERATYGFED